MVYSLSLEKNNTMVLSGRKVLLVALTIVTAILPVKAEGLKFNLAFDGLFDNREFKGDVMPQTIYGMRLTPEIGIERGNHLIMGGVSKIWEFGSKGDIDPTPVLYYKFTQDKWSASFGNIPRTHLQRQLPDAFLYDSIAFFEPVIGGTLIQYYGSDLEVELYCNWFSRQRMYDREAFRIVNDLQYNLSFVSVGYYAALTHFAGSIEPGHSLYEKFMFNPWIRFDFSEFMPANTVLKLEGGLLGSGIRCRTFPDWNKYFGFLGKIEAGWKWFNVQSTFYKGDCQQEFLHDPDAGIQFHRSDPFYNHTFYNKTRMGIQFYDDGNIAFGFNWNIHFTPDTPIHHQQMITVKYRFEPADFFKKR
jgi:hypothetical protein